MFDLTPASNMVAACKLFFKKISYMHQLIRWNKLEGSA
jgi:hypothetical protein